MKKFDSIRPYHDDEVHQVLIDLSNNRRFLKMLFSTGRFNKIKYLPFSRKILSFVLKNRIKSELAGSIWGKNENTNIRLRFDNQVIEALKHFNEADAFIQSSN